eukprot:5994759-Prymnesium_polylepis.1
MSGDWAARCTEAAGTALGATKDAASGAHSASKSETTQRILAPLLEIGRGPGQLLETGGAI